MTKKKFKPGDWLQDINTKKTNSTFSPPSGKTHKEFSPPPGEMSEGQRRPDIETIISQIESLAIDITPNYSDWRDIGFALSDEFGENGRSHFHRVSRFYLGYSTEECNKQFTSCLKSKGHGVTIKTFFHLAKQAGINISSFPMKQEFSPPLGETKRGSSSPLGEMPERQKSFNTPTLPPEIYSNLPEILKESTDLFADAIEKDVFLIGALTVISGCLPNIEGIYFDEPHSAHLFAFITAPAASGKGKLKWAKYYGLTIHEFMIKTSNSEKADYKSELEQYQNMNKKEKQDTEKPEQPAFKMFFIPANSSSSAFIQALSDNNFCGVIFETEADTLAGTFKQEWGNFSDVLRKAFQHESTSMFRRKDNEFIEIKDPHLAMALSGTPRQVRNLMPDVENGLFSRFLYYAFEDDSDFKNPFISHRSVNYVKFFKEHGQYIFDLYQQLDRLQLAITFMLTVEQGEEFTTMLNEMLSRNKLLLGSDFDANIKRLGLITFRIAMILSALRILENGLPQDQLICSDFDFSTALSIAATLEKHAIAVFQYLPSNEFIGVKLKFLQALPKQFNRQTYLDVAGQLGIKPKTAEKYLTQFREKNLILHEHNQYTKSDYIK